MNTFHLLFVQSLFVFDHGLGWIAIPRMSSRLLKPAGGIHPPSRDVPRPGERRCPGCTNAFRQEPPEDFQNLMLAETPAPEFGQNAVVPDDAKLRLLPGIV